MATADFNQARDLAIKYGDKKVIGRMAAMGMVEPTTAVLAGMMLDRIVANAIEPPETTVTEDVFAPPQADLGAIAPQGMGGQMPMGQMPMGQPQMAQAPQQGLNQIPVPEQMFEPQGMAGGGIVAFSSGNLVNYSQFGPMGKRIEEEEKLREAYLGKDQSVADLMSYIQGLEGKSKERAERMFNLRLVQAGLGMAAGSSPYALQNIAQGAIPAIAGHAGDTEKQEEAEFGRKRVLAELGGRARAEKIGVLGEARRAEEAEKLRKSTAAEAEKGRTFTASESVLDRASRERVAAKNRKAQENIAKIPPKELQVAAQLRTDDPTMSYLESIRAAAEALSPKDSYNATRNALTKAADAVAAEMKMLEYMNPDIAEIRGKALKGDLAAQEAYNQIRNQVEKRVFKEYQVGGVDLSTGTLQPRGSPVPGPPFRSGAGQVDLSHPLLRGQ